MEGNDLKIVFCYKFVLLKSILWILIIVSIFTLNVGIGRWDQEGKFL